MLRSARPARWKLLFSPLKATEYEAVIADVLVSGALVNQDNFHWIALVKHNGLLWHVDSRYDPAPMDQVAFRACMHAHPGAFAIAQQAHPGN